VPSTNLLWAVSVQQCCSRVRPSSAARHQREPFQALQVVSHSSLLRWLLLSIRRRCLQSSLLTHAFGSVAKRSD